MTTAMTIAAVVAASSLAAGCHDEPAFVVLVVNSDLVSPSEVNTFGVSVAPGPFEPPPGFAPRWSIGTLPTSLAIVSQRQAPSFSIVVQLLDVPIGNEQIVVNKTVTDIRFVAEETRMLLLELPRSCACEGTSCPLPGDPACDRITNPALVPFDAALAPAIELAPRFAEDGNP